ncbi:phosphoethanolamine transferase [Chitinimonas sp. BJB300]|uniref:phosphoethanolamine transferase n=1 Tax=Chitinimonas sp. BJB300 TaxID=1559339 RepID=UPI000C11C8BF|nr:phosphoethanolamine--lipid A transferase [Chitinimonas sp. BJB300]PHV09824.1 phosphoethanolamine transferase [Chitinimonas sp. BJB300]TSJ87359.1 phosphoethanolamine--lipid A transferase [Chitinimonas sp. BJB300]
MAFTHPDPQHTALNPPPRKWFQYRPQLSVETLTGLACIFFITACNTLFWQAALDGRDIASLQSWRFAGAVGLALAAVHFAILLLFMSRWTIKPLLGVLFVVTGFATYYMQRYHVYFDTSMIRNVLRTDVKEARDLMAWGLLPHLLIYVGLPLLVLARINIKTRPLRRALLIRIGCVVAGLLIAVGATLLVFQEFSSLMRNQKAIRHLITPGNYLVSLGRVLASDVKGAQKPIQAIGTDAKLAPSWQKRSKPTVFVLVVGETARAMNWGLNGYTRQTTPELAKLDVINFPDVQSCGSNTEVSVPCMFSQYGRHNYDEDAIKQHESVLHVLSRASIKVLWRDNQSGCKGVCNGLETESTSNDTDPTLCQNGSCFDEIMLKGLRERIDRETGNIVIVMHQMGNHGPAYYNRYPAAMRRFTPTCDTSDLGKCSVEAVRNSYDNALLYTDHFLAETVKLLASQTSHDAAMIYVSDHGESLGENGIFLHGLPYSIAPKEQTSVPMVMWASPGYASSFGLDTQCMQAQRTKPLTHDNLFHTMLGMLDVNTSVYDRSYDFVSSCRKQAVQ